MWTAASIGLVMVIAASFDAWADSAKPPVHAPPAHKLALKAHKAAVHHRRTSRARSRGGVLVLANCYGRFIAWRDELAGLMQLANSYTPSPEDRNRFDRMEQAFAAGARRDRKLTLTLQPTFREADFPVDIRIAFRAGLNASSAAFIDKVYRDKQSDVISQAGPSPRQRMARLEANADEAFAPLAASCE